MATIREININISNRDFTVKLDSSGHFEVEGGLTFNNGRRLSSLDNVKSAIQEDMEYMAEQYPGEPYMSYAEWDARRVAEARAEENAEKREEAAEKRATAAELGRVSGVYTQGGYGRAEAVKVRGISARGRRSGRGFNITTLSTGEKEQDATVYRFTPALAAAMNKVADKREALNILTGDDVSKLRETRTLIRPTTDGWTVTVQEQLSFHDRRDPKVYAEHEVTFTDDGTFVADDGTSAPSLDDLTRKLAAEVHPALGKWLITTDDDNNPIAVEATPEVLADLTSAYYWVEVVEDEATATSLLAQRVIISELDEWISKVYHRIRNHPSYSAYLSRDDLANWPVLDVDILPENDVEVAADDDEG